MRFLIPSNYPTHGGLWFFKELGLLAGSAVQLEECLLCMYKVLGLSPALHQTGWGITVLLWRWMEEDQMFEFSWK